MTIERVSTMRNLLLPKNTTDENAHLVNMFVDVMMVRENLYSMK